MINERIVIEEKTKDYNEAWIETYFWQESEELYPGQKRPVIVICPGGAYGMTSDREAEAIAVRFMGMGYHAVVLRYSCLLYTSFFHSSHSENSYSKTDVYYFFPFYIQIPRKHNRKSNST